MKAETVLGRGGPVARSLRIGGSTHLMAAAFSAAIALNGTLAFGALGAIGEEVVLLAIFISVAACSAAISVDVLNRSAKAVSDLRSIGASRGSISSALFGSLLSYGVTGSAVGGVAGAAIGAGLSGSFAALQILAEVAIVVAATSGAVAAGAYAGGRLTWRS